VVPAEAGIDPDQHKSSAVFGKFDLFVIEGGHTGIPAGPGF
jgi:hypothetical protein